jgi:hypothetical protein
MPRNRRTARARGIAWALLVSLLAGSPAMAAFEVVSGRTAITSDAIVTHAEVKLSLSEEVTEALRKGIEIRVLVTLRLYRVRPLIWDEQIAEWEAGFRLKYHDLSTTYVLVAERSGDLETFATIRDALDSLSRMRIELPVITETMPGNEHGYRVSMRVDLDRTTLPPPLKLVSEISSAWNLGGGWTQWSVEP